MGSQMVLPFAMAGADLKQNPDLLRHARTLGIESAERSRLEEMCLHAGLRYQGLDDAALRRSLRIALA
ncbi:MAG: hypothetical protein ACRBC3_16525 [Burkholderiaceae bacterium]